MENQGFLASRAASPEKSVSSPHGSSMGTHSTLWDGNSPSAHHSLVAQGPPPPAKRLITHLSLCLFLAQSERVSDPFLLFLIYLLT